MKNIKPFLLATASAILLSACALSPDGPSNESITQLMKQSFAERGAAKLDRLEQSELQRVCSEYTVKEMPKAVKEKLEQAALASVKYPADGKYLGDFSRGERIAQSGVGMQFSDAPGTVAGGNCYACHQISKQELAYGNIGPSLYNYGKLRGDSDYAAIPRQFLSIRGRESITRMPLTPAIQCHVLGLRAFSQKRR
ncbi:MAG: sulfur oxidation c-type cytochrome SoxX [Pseudomonadota bacterium]